MKRIKRSKTIYRVVGVGILMCGLGLSAVQGGASSKSEVSVEDILAAEKQAWQSTAPITAVLTQDGPGTVYDIAERTITVGEYGAFSLTTEKWKVYSDGRTVWTESPVGSAPTVQTFDAWIQDDPQIHYFIVRDPLFTRPEDYAVATNTEAVEGVVCYRMQSKHKTVWVDAADLRKVVRIELLSDAAGIVARFDFSGYITAPGGNVLATKVVGREYGTNGDTTDWIVELSGVKNATEDKSGFDSALFSFTGPTVGKRILDDDCECEDCVCNMP